MSGSIVLGGGCFWCLEALYAQVKGITRVEPGYAGGDYKNPKFEDLHHIDTGHAEVVKLTFDSSIISLDQILEIFWHIHDPTTPNRQGNDVGSEYRSIILYDKTQEKVVRYSLDNIAKRLWNAPIVTELKQTAEFYPAEDFHTNYYINNPNNGYCQVVINPKLSKFKKDFSKYLK